MERPWHVHGTQLLHPATQLIGAGAVLCQLFESGEADLNDMATTDYMNEVWQNHQDLFGHITVSCNFHTNFCHIAAEYLTVNGMNGAHCKLQGAMLEATTLALAPAPAMWMTLTMTIT